MNQTGAGGTNQKTKKKTSANVLRPMTRRRGPGTDGVGLLQPFGGVRRSFRSIWARSVKIAERLNRTRNQGKDRGGGTGETLSEVGEENAKRGQASWTMLGECYGGGASNGAGGVKRHENRKKTWVNRRTPHSMYSIRLKSFDIAGVGKRPDSQPCIGTGLEKKRGIAGRVEGRTTGIDRCEDLR